MMDVYGSQPSPYVRRIRLLLADTPYQFHSMDLANPGDRERLRELSPVLKIPVLVDAGKTIWDSRQIFRYLQQKNLHGALSQQQENLLTTIDGVCDSLVQLLLVERSGVTLDASNSYRKINFDRIDRSAEFLDQAVVSGDFKDWNYPSICLYSLIDWASFRERYAFKNLANLWGWYLDNGLHPGVEATDPRNTTS